MVTIQSLLDENPLHNEPGFENENSHRNTIYNEIVQYDTFRHLILKNCFDIPPDFKFFESVIKEHLIKEKDNILEKIKTIRQGKKNKDKLSINIYNLSVITDYNNTENRLTEMLTNIKL